jgi:uncharacterized protein YgbK (DUF1537 family)
MSRILVIADDFTGAAEIGGIATAFGLNAQIACGHLTRASSDALIMDSDTRHLPPRQASEQLRSLLWQVDPRDFDFIYKKTDSVLRGSVAAEIKTIADVLGLGRSLLIPQNPSRGRTIENGVYLIDGVELHRTTFAGDPEFPARTAGVRELLDPLGAFDVGTFAAHESHGETGISIGEAKSTDELDRWASKLADNTLPAGGADFFAAILRHRKLVFRELPPVAVKTSGALFICGSASSESRRVTGALARTCLMPRILFDAGALDEASLENWRRTICDEMQTCGRAVVAVGHPSNPERAAHVRRMLGEVAARVMRSCVVESLYIEGGATAAAVIGQLGWLDLSVVGQLSPGVAVLRPLGEPNRTLVVKPGSYPWPEKLLDQ